MNYSKFDLSKVKYNIDLVKKCIQVGYDTENSIKIETPVMMLPFGVDYISKIKKYYVKMMFENYKNNIDMESFYNVMMNIEKNIDDYINKYVSSDYNVASEFKFSGRFDPLINSKLLSYNNCVKTKILSANGSDIDYINIQKKDRVKCILELNSIWPMNNTFCYKWTILEMKIL